MRNMRERKCWWWRSLVKKKDMRKGGGVREEGGRVVGGKEVREAQRRGKSWGERYTGERKMEEGETMASFSGELTQLIDTGKLHRHRMWGQGEHQWAAIAETVYHKTTSLKREQFPAIKIQCQISAYFWSVINHRETSLTSLSPSRRSSQMRYCTVTE